ncbi:MAG: NFACT family protein, partial [Rhodothermales bacterium]|nr:NFACT family protein [Rhodothermales bacterium]
MLNTYYTYRALVEEWNEMLAGDSVAAVYSSRRREITVELASGSAIVFGVRKSFRYLFRSERTGRPRRNVAALMEEVAGARVLGVRMADRDRVLSIDLAGDLELRYFLFGSRPNVLLLREGQLVDAHKGARDLHDKPVPASRPAYQVTDATEFLSRARNATTAVRAVTSGFPLFDSVLARETLFRAGVEAQSSVEEALESAAALFETAREIEKELETPEVCRAYLSEGGEITFSLTSLEHLAGSQATEFESVDSALNTCSRMMLRRMQYEEEIGPVRSTLDDRLQKAERRLREVTEHLERTSRADELERMGHLLMASGRGSEVGLESISVSDHFRDGETTEIRLDSALSVVENAQQYYDRARRSRASRQSAADRIESARADVEALQQMASELEAVV